MLRDINVILSTLRVNGYAFYIRQVMCSIFYIRCPNKGMPIVWQPRVLDSDDHDEASNLNLYNIISRSTRSRQAFHLLYKLGSAWPLHPLEENPAIFQCMYSQYHVSTLILQSIRALKYHNEFFYDTALLSRNFTECWRLAWLTLWTGLGLNIVSPSECPPSHQA